MKVPQLSSRVWLAICAFLLSISVVLGVLLVQDHLDGPRHGSGMGPSKGPRLGKIDRLTLPPEQKQQVRQLFREHRRSHRQVARGLRKLKWQMHQALVDPTVSTQQLEAAFAEVAAQQTAIERSRLRFTLELRQLIGAENMKPLYREIFTKRKRPGKRGRRKRDDGDRENRRDRD